MGSPNIQLYNLLRQELHMSDGKSLELMHVLDKEYKSGVKEDLERFEGRMDSFESRTTDRFDRFEKKLDDRFDKMDARFDKIDARFEKVDERFEKIDTQFGKIDERFNKIDAHFITHDKHLDTLDNKIDQKFGDLRGELRVEIRDSKVATIQWVVSIFFALALMIIGLYFKNSAA